MTADIRTDIHATPPAALREALVKSLNLVSIRILRELGMAELDELLESVGLGNQVPQIVARRLVPEEEGIIDKLLHKLNSSGKSIAIRGTEGLVVSYARCCRPLPGDDIMGHLSAGRGVVIHRQKCRNINAEMRASPDKCLPLRWSDKVDREFQSELRIALINQRGLLATIASVPAA
mgnify:CR=1 FL=1